MEAVPRIPERREMRGGLGRRSMEDDEVLFPGEMKGLGKGAGSSSPFS